MQQRQQAVGVGIVVASVTGVDQQRQPRLRTQGAQLPVAGVIQRITLNVRVDLYAVQAEGNQVADVGGHIRAFGVRRAKPRKAVGTGHGCGGNKFIDALHLLWLGSDRLDDKVINPGRRAGLQQLLHAAGVMGFLAVKGGGRLGGGRQDFVGIYMAVGVDHPETVLQHGDLL